MEFNRYRQPIEQVGVFVKDIENFHCFRAVQKDDIYKMIPVVVLETIMMYDLPYSLFEDIFTIARELMNDQFDVSHFKGTLTRIYTDEDFGQFEEIANSPNYLEFFSTVVSLAFYSYEHTYPGLRLFDTLANVFKYKAKVANSTFPDDIIFYNTPNSLIQFFILETADDLLFLYPYQWCYNTIWTSANQQLALISSIHPEATISDLSKSYHDFKSIERTFEYFNELNTDINIDAEELKLKHQESADSNVSLEDVIKIYNPEESLAIAEAYKKNNQDLFQLVRQLSEQEKQQPPPQRQKPRKNMSILEELNSEAPLDDETFEVLSARMSDELASANLFTHLALQAEAQRESENFSFFSEKAKSAKMASNDTYDILHIHLFKKRNPDFLNSSKLDLHNLRLHEAKKAVSEFLFTRTVKFNVVEIITGRGLHSTGGIPAIKNYTKEFLLRHPQFEVKELLGGFKVSLK